MNLQQLHDLANTRSYYSRTDADIYAALNAASRKVYLWTSREFRGYFFKTDTTSVAFAAGVQQYQLPVDLRILIRFGEQLVNSTLGTPYRWLQPSDINSAQFIGREFESVASDFGGPVSEFLYSGPFLADADALALPNQPGQPGDQVRSVLISPIPSDARQTKIFYAAAFVEIVGPQSPVMMPVESHDALLDIAVAELVRPNGDAMLAESYATAGKEKFQEDFLPWMRMAQTQQVPATQEPYLADLS
jgi:hypothetical protein